MEIICDNESLITVNKPVRLLSIRIVCKSQYLPILRLHNVIPITRYHDLLPSLHCIILFIFIHIIIYWFFQIILGYFNRFLCFQITTHVHVISVSAHHGFVFSLCYWNYSSIQTTSTTFLLYFWLESTQRKFRMSEIYIHFYVKIYVLVARESFNQNHFYNR